MDVPAWAALAERLVRGNSPSVAARPSIDEFALWLRENKRLTPFVADKIELARAVRATCSLVVYTAGALTGASESDKERYVTLGEVVDGYQRRGARMFGYVPHVHGTDPKNHPDVTAQEVHDVDLLWSTFAAHLQLHCMWPVAHGNGAEAGWASIFGVPAVYFTPTNQKVSRLMLGTHNAPVAFFYRDFAEDCVPAVRQLLDILQVKLLA